MIPCEKCAARGQDPCRTATGMIAREMHKVRIVDAIGELERLTIMAVGDATWIVATDAPKVEDVLVAARELDRFVRDKAAMAAGETPQLFDTPGNTPGDGIDGTLLYAADTLGRMLDSLGLSPIGRLNLGIEMSEEGPDELAEAIALHTA